MEAGIQTYKTIAKQFIIGIGMLYSIITVKNEYYKLESYEEKRVRAQELLNTLNKQKEELKKLENEKAYNNFIQKMHLNRIESTHKKVMNHEKEQSELMKTIKEREIK
jgi:uncharacterized protein YlxW (UPF0749 family)